MPSKATELSRNRSSPIGIVPKQIALVTIKSPKHPEATIPTFAAGSEVIVPSNTVSRSHVVPTVVGYLEARIQKSPEPGVVKLFKFKNICNLIKLNNRILSHSNTSNQPYYLFVSFICLIIKLHILYHKNGVFASDTSCLYIKDIKDTYY